MGSKIEMTAYHNRALSGPNGEPLKVEYVEIKESPDREGVVREWVVMGGMATDVLVNNYNPGQGSEPLPDNETVAWEWMFPLSGDTQMKVKEVNSAFLPEKPLVDGSETFLRFLPDQEDSIYDDLTTKGVYVKVQAKAKEGADPSKAVPVYFNLLPLTKRTSVTDKAAVNALVARLKKKKEQMDSVPF
jgi:hypothetical protein